MTSGVWMDFVAAAVSLRLASQTTPIDLVSTLDSSSSGTTGVAPSGAPFAIVISTNSRIRFSRRN